MEDPPTTICKICGSDKLVPLFDAKDRLSNTTREFSVAECTSCEVWSTLPEMTESEIGEFYPSDYWGTEPTQEWVLRSQAAKLDVLKTFGLQSGRILDIGCGSGYFLRSLEPDKWDRYGVETGDKAVIAARSYLGKERIFDGQISSLEKPERLFDVVTLWSSLEHMNRPIDEMRSIVDHLQINGSIVIQVPNKGSYQARYFRRHWFALDLPRHRHHFCLTSLQRFLSSFGLKIDRVTTVSREHNLHSARQSLKSLLSKWQTIGRLAFLLVRPLTWPVDKVMSRLGHGATITVLVSKGND